MSVDIDIISEIYRVMKEYIPAKDKQAAADHVCSIVADAGVSDHELKEFCGEDSYLGRAIKDYIYEEEADEDTD